MPEVQALSMSIVIVVDLVLTGVFAVVLIRLAKRWR